MEQQWSGLMDATWAGQVSAQPHPHPPKAPWFSSLLPGPALRPWKAEPHLSLYPPLPLPGCSERMLSPLKDRRCDCTETSVCKAGASPLAPPPVDRKLALTLVLRGISRGLALACPDQNSTRWG